MSDLYYFKFVVAFVFVISLMFALSWLVKKLNLGQPSVARRKHKRLRVAEYLVLDGKNRMALITRDDETQHLILLGVNGNVVVERNIPIVADETSADLLASDKTKVQKVA